MNALSIISELTRKKIRVTMSGSQVTLSAPKGTLTDDLVTKVRRAKPALIQSLRAIRKKAGADWDDVASDPSQLQAFTELLMIEQMREQGVAPDHYTAVTNCQHCGTVPIFKGCPPQVSGCPWCFNRIKGLAVPAIGRKSIDSRASLRPSHI